MNPERWNQINNLFQAARERPKGERLVFLRRACAGDLELQQEIESLLNPRRTESPQAFRRRRQVS
jgi:hypothetical protein